MPGLPTECRAFRDEIAIVFPRKTEENTIRYGAATAGEHDVRQTTPGPPTARRKRLI